MGLFCRVPSGLQPHGIRNGFSPFRCRGRGSPVGSHAPSRPHTCGREVLAQPRPRGRPRRGKTTGHPLPAPCPQGMRFLYNITPELAHTPHIHLHGGAFFTGAQWDSTYGMRNGFSPFRCRGRGLPVASHAPSPPRPALGGYPQRSWGRGGRPEGEDHTPPAPSPHARRHALSYITLDKACGSGSMCAKSWFTTWRKRSGLKGPGALLVDSVASIEPTPISNENYPM